MKLRRKISNIDWKDRDNTKFLPKLQTCNIFNVIGLYPDRIRRRKVAKGLTILPTNLYRRKLVKKILEEQGWV